MTLEQVKAHLRVTHDAEDALIQSYMTAAEQLVSQYLGEDLPEPVPEPITAAMMLLVGDLYTNRSRQGLSALYQNKTYSLLLDPYRSAEVM